MKKIFYIFTVAMIAAMMSGCFIPDCDCDPYDGVADNIRAELMID